jgi:hypothetical protein
MPSCEFCGCKVSAGCFHTICEPAYGVYICGKSECDEQLAEFIREDEQLAEFIRENENDEAVDNGLTTAQA